ncbi:MAG: GrpB family protein [Defluviitaleaceae bacterium]|nr:GrpB family protein [Defluviitaleaceae bacterium]
MLMRNIIVVPYDEIWVAEFEKIMNEILPILGDMIISIEHVGSTSVKGLYAKPIIDINIVIDSKDMLPTIVQGLEKINYTHVGDLGIRDRDAFKYVDKPHLMEHHLYVCPKDSLEHNRHVTFRDYLRLHPDDCEKYSKIKIEMAKKFPHDIDNYINGKQAVILEIYEKCGLDISYKS